MKGKELCNSSGSLDKDNLNALLDKEFKTQGNSFEDLSFKDLAGIYEGINLYTSSKLNSTNLNYSVRTGFINALTEKFILNSSISDNAKKLFLSTMNALTEYKTDVHSFSILGRVHANNLFKQLNQALAQYANFNKDENASFKNHPSVIILIIILKKLYNPMNIKL